MADQVETVVLSRADWERWQKLLEEVSRRVDRAIKIAKGEKPEEADG